MASKAGPGRRTRSMERRIVQGDVVGGAVDLSDKLHHHPLCGLAGTLIFRIQLVAATVVVAVTFLVVSPTDHSQHARHRSTVNKREPPPGMSRELRTEGTPPILPPCQSDQTGEQRAMRGYKSDACGTKKRVFMAAEEDADKVAPPSSDLVCLSISFD